MSLFLQTFLPERTGKLRPLMSFPISAGQPKPNPDAEISWLDLNDYVGRRDSAILYVRVAGDSMIDDGICDGDLLVVDRMIEPFPGDIIIARLDDEFTVKKFERKAGQLYLVPANGNYKTRRLRKQDDFEIVGVVTFKVQRMR